MAVGSAGAPRSACGGHASGRGEYRLDVAGQCLLHDLKAQRADLVPPVQEDCEAVVRFPLQGIDEREGERGAGPSAVGGFGPDTAGLYDEVPIAASSRGEAGADDILSGRNEVPVHRDEGQPSRGKVSRIPAMRRAEFQIHRRGLHDGLGQHEIAVERRPRRPLSGAGHKRSIIDHGGGLDARKQLPGVEVHELACAGGQGEPLHHEQDGRTESRWITHEASRVELVAKVRRGQRTAAPGDIFFETSRARRRCRRRAA